MNTPRPTPTLPPPAPVRIGDAIRQLRFVRQLTAASLAERMETSRSYVSKVEGNCCTPTIDNLFSFARALDVDVCALLDADVRNDVIERALSADPFFAELLPFVGAMTLEQRQCLWNNAYILAASRIASARAFAYRAHAQERAL